jgi:hypothetical protein
MGQAVADHATSTSTQEAGPVAEDTSNTDPPTAEALAAQLEQVRQELATATARVAELEGQSVQEQLTATAEENDRLKLVIAGLEKRIEDIGTYLEAKAEEQATAEAKDASRDTRLAAIRGLGAPQVFDDEWFAAHTGRVVDMEDDEFDAYIADLKPLAAAAAGAAPAPGGEKRTTAMGGGVETVATEVAPAVAVLQDDAPDLDGTSTAELVQAAFAGLGQQMFTREKESSR